MLGNFLSSLESCQHLHCKPPLGIVEGYYLAVKEIIGILWVMCANVDLTASEKCNTPIRDYFPGFTM